MHPNTHLRLPGSHFFLLKKTSQILAPERPLWFKPKCVAWRVRDTDASYYPAHVARTTLETATNAWTERKPMRCQNLQTENFRVSSGVKINARKQKPGREQKREICHLYGLYPSISHKRRERLLFCREVKVFTCVHFLFQRAVNI